MSPILAELAEERPDVRFVKVDVDDNLETAARYGVMSMPTFMVFRNGEPVLKLIGSRRKSRLVEELAEVHLAELRRAAARRSSRPRAGARRP